MNLHIQTMHQEDTEFIHEDNIESDLIDHSSGGGTPVSLDSFQEDTSVVVYTEEDDMYEQSFSSPFYTLPNEDSEATPVHDIKRRRNNSMENAVPSFANNNEFGDSRDLNTKAALQPCPIIIEKIELKKELVDQETPLGSNEELPTTPTKRKRGRPPGKKKTILKEFEVFSNSVGNTFLNGAFQHEANYYSPTHLTVPMSFYLPSTEDQTQNNGSSAQSPVSMSGSQTPIKRGRGRPRKLPLPIQAPGEDWNSYNMRVAATHGPNFRPMDVHLNLPSDTAICDYVLLLQKQRSPNPHDDPLSLESMKHKLDTYFHVDFSCRYNFLKEVYYLLYL